MSDSLTYPTITSNAATMLATEIPGNFRKRSSRIVLGTVTASTEVADWASPSTEASHYDTIVADCTAGDVTLTMPKAARNVGRTIEVIRADGSGNDVILRFGGVTFTLSAALETALCISTGSNWLVRVETFPGGDIVASIGYGEISVADNGAGTAQTVGTTFTKITQFDTDGLSLNFTNAHASDTITPASDGVVEVFFTVSASGTASRTLTFAVFSNAVEQTNLRAAATLDASGNPLCYSGSALLSVTAAQAIDLRVKGSAASTDVLIEEGVLRARVVA